MLQPAILPRSSHRAPPLPAVSPIRPLTVRRFSRRVGVSRHPISFPTLLLRVGINLYTCTAMVTSRRTMFRDERGVLCALNAPGKRPSLGWHEGPREGWGMSRKGSRLSKGGDQHIPGWYAASCRPDREDLSLHSDGKRAIEFFISIFEARWSSTCGMTDWKYGHRVEKQC